jgi:hypothetical protein
MLTLFHDIFDAPVAVLVIIIIIIIIITDDDVLTAMLVENDRTSSSAGRHICRAVVRSTRDGVAAQRAARNICLLCINHGGVPREMSCSGK